MARFGTTWRTFAVGATVTAVIAGLTGVASQSAQAAPAPADSCAQPKSVAGQAVPHVTCAAPKGKLSAKAAAAQTAAQTPAPDPGHHMTFHGGKIMPTSSVYNIFWLPAGQHFESAATAASDTAYQNLLNQFFSDVGNSDLMEVMRITPGSDGTPTLAPTNRLAGSYTDTTAYPHAGSAADPLQDADISAAVARAATTNGWTKDINHLYMVYTAYGIDECNSATSCNFPVTATPTAPTSGFAYCAYHTYTGSTYYAFQGDDSSEAYGGSGCSLSTSPNGDAAADSEVSTASHEYFEALTDPELNAWYNVDGAGENGDLCAYNTGPTNAIGANLYLQGHAYVIQREWHNVLDTCTMDSNAADTSDVPPNLAVTKAGPATAVAGQTINYTITVNNPSNTNASTLTTVTDTLPPGVTYVPGSANPGPSSTSPLTWDLATIAVHDTSTITYQATVSSPAAINNCAVANYQDEYQIAAAGPSQGCVGTTVTQGQTTTSLASSANPSVFGQAVTFTATVSATAPAAGTPTGSVQFFDGATSLGTATLSGGQATLTTSTLSVGSHSITATYNGDPSFLTSTSAVLTQVVNKQPTTTALTCVPPSAHVNQAVTCTATVSPTIPNPTPPTGTVSFYIDGSATAAATVPLTGNQAAFTTTFGGGTHTVVAVYNGDANYESSTSPPATVTVLCDVTITGTHSALNVTSGTTCVINAHITGGISVAPGAILDVENSTVSGSISANKPAGFRMCGSHTGTVLVTGATGFVLIGDPANNCPSNVIAGNITAVNNTHGLVIIGNQYSGSFTVSGNSGAGPLPGEGSPVVSGNHH